MKKFLTSAHDIDTSVAASIEPKYYANDFLQICSLGEGLTHFTSTTTLDYESIVARNLTGRKLGITLSMLACKEIDLPGTVYAVCDGRTVLFGGIVSMPTLYTVRTKTIHIVDTVTGEKLFTFIRDKAVKLTFTALSFSGSVSVPKRYFFPNRFAEPTIVTALIYDSTDLDNCKLVETKYCWFGGNTDNSDLLKAKLMEEQSPDITFTAGGMDYDARWDCSLQAFVTPDLPTESVRGTLCISYNNEEIIRVIADMDYSIPQVRIVFTLKELAY